jgi:hypothetical protein
MADDNLFPDHQRAVHFVTGQLPAPSSTEEGQVAFIHSARADKAAIIGAIYAALGLEGEGFGCNLDGLFDVLTSVTPSASRVLVFEFGGELWKEDPLVMGRLLEVFLDAAAAEREHSRTLNVVFCLEEAPASAK